MSARTGILLLATLCQPIEAAAAMIDAPYAQKVISWNGSLESVGNALRLDQAAIGRAKQMAGAWVNVGPCAAANVSLQNTAAGASVALMTNPNPADAFHSAVLQMVAIMTADNLGRKPSADLCRFADEISRQ